MPCRDGDQTFGVEKTAEHYQNNHAREPADARGRELTGAIMDTLGARKVRFVPKVSVAYPVVVLTAQGSLAGETKNLSTREAFVRCSEPLPLNDLATVNIEIAKGESLLAEAEVVWSNIYGPDDEITPRGMIVRFTNLSDSHRRRLHAVIARHYERKLAVKAETS